MSAQIKREELRVDKQLNIRLRAVERELISELAQRQGMTMSAYTREIILRYLQDNNFLPKI